MLQREFTIVVDRVFPIDNSPCISNEIEQDKVYYGQNPMQASKKIFTKIAKLAKCNECSYIFMIKETTIGKTCDKLFTYIGVKYKLKMPIDVSKGESYFQVNYKSDVKSYKKELPTHPDSNENQVLNNENVILPIDPELLDKICKEPIPWFIAKKVIPSY